jgi:hypothetical protein
MQRTPRGIRKPKPWRKPKGAAESGGRTQELDVSAERGSRTRKPNTAAEQRNRAPEPNTGAKSNFEKRAKVPTKRFVPRTIGSAQSSVRAGASYVGQQAHDSLPASAFVRCTTGGARTPVTPATLRTSHQWRRTINRQCRRFVCSVTSGAQTCETVDTSYIVRSGARGRLIESTYRTSYKRWRANL